MALVKERLGLDVTARPGRRGQFEVIADGETLAERGGNWLTRSLGLGYPSAERLVQELERRAAADPASG